jgi:SAM-dependent methyltransferase
MLAVAGDVAAINRRFYDALWRSAELQSPERFNTWPLLSRLARVCRARLEVGPGLRPRLPIAGTTFIDASQPAVAQLEREGGDARLGDASALPFADASFDLVCAFDVIEHVVDDLSVFRELTRVLRPGGTLVLSVPLHAAAFNDFDAFVGHARRYDPERLLVLLGQHGLSLSRSAVFGMQPADGPLLRWGLWWLRHFPATALFWYNRLVLPVGLRLQRPLALVEGWIDARGVDEAVVLCRRQR